MAKTKGMLLLRLMHRPGIEPGAGRLCFEDGSPEWQRPILPLNHQCFLMNNFHSNESRPIKTEHLMLDRVRGRPHDRAIVLNNGGG
jgi:hypothetical protein